MHHKEAILLKITVPVSVLTHDTCTCQYRIMYSVSKNNMVWDGSCALGTGSLCVSELEAEPSSHSAVGD